MIQTKKMRTGKCWFQKGDFDHFGMCFGFFRAHFGPEGSLKQPQHVILDPGVPKTAQHVRKVKNDADQKDAHLKMLVSKG